MNLRKRVERIERQVGGQVQVQEDCLSVVDRLLGTPVGELVPGRPALEPDAVRVYYAFTLAHLSFSRERPEFYPPADLDEWRARSRHAESLVDALEQQDGACGVREAAQGSLRVWVNGLRHSLTRECKDRIPL